MKNSKLHRRHFLKNIAVTGAVYPFLSWQDAFSRATHAIEEELEIHVFSKHLQFLDYQDMAAAVSEIGFSGADLTVRPDGHVLPERVKADLPRAVAALKDHGLEAKLMTTAITGPDELHARETLETAAGLGVRFYRSGWLRYPEDKTIPEAIEDFKPQIRKLADLNRKLGLHGAYQNHSGLYVGASIWEIWELLEHADPAGMGCQYDIRHATVEGGLSWKTGLRLIQPRIKMIVLKDFRWEKANGKWQAVNTPLGEGMVDFDAYFKLLKKYGVRAPVSLHLEYDLGGAQHGDREITIPEEKVFEAMKRDLETAQRLWREA